MVGKVNHRRRDRHNALRNHALQDSSVGRAMDQNAHSQRSEHADSLTQVTVLLLALPCLQYSPSVQSHVSTSVRTLKKTGSHTIVWTHKNP